MKANLVTEKLDVVIPTKGEWTLPYCTRSARHSIPIRNLILVVPSFFKEEAEKYGATVVVFDEKNVGKARNEGLKLVETPIYVSIDADVQVTPEWFKWCWQTIQQPDVAACQGYAKTQQNTTYQFKWSTSDREGSTGKASVASAIRF